MAASAPGTSEANCARVLDAEVLAAAAFRLAGRVDPRCTWDDLAGEAVGAATTHLESRAGGSQHERDAAEAALAWRCYGDLHLGLTESLSKSPTRRRIVSLSSSCKSAVVIALSGDGATAGETAGDWEAAHLVAVLRTHVAFQSALTAAAQTAAPGRGGGGGHPRNQAGALSLQLQGLAAEAATRAVDTRIFCPPPGGRVPFAFRSARTEEPSAVGASAQGNVAVHPECGAAALVGGFVLHLWSSATAAERFVAHTSAVANAVLSRAAGVVPLIAAPWTARLRVCGLDVTATAMCPPLLQHPTLIDEAIAKDSPLGEQLLAAHRATPLVAAAVDGLLQWARSAANVSGDDQSENVPYIEAFAAAKRHQVDARLCCDGRIYVLTTRVGVWDTAGGGGGGCFGAAVWVPPRELGCDVFHVQEQRQRAHLDQATAFALRSAVGRLERCVSMGASAAAFICPAPQHWPRGRSGAAAAEFDAVLLPALAARREARVPARHLGAMLSEAGTDAAKTALIAEMAGRVCAEVAVVLMRSFASRGDSVAEGGSSSSRSATQCFAAAVRAVRGLVRWSDGLNDADVEAMLDGGGWDGAASQAASEDPAMACTARAGISFWERVVLPLAALRYGNASLLLTRRPPSPLNAGGAASPRTTSLSGEGSDSGHDDFSSGASRDNEDDSRSIALHLLRYTHEGYNPIRGNVALAAALDAEAVDAILCRKLGLHQDSSITSDDQLSASVAVKLSACTTTRLDLLSDPRIWGTEARRQPQRSDRRNECGAAMWGQERPLFIAASEWCTFLANLRVDRFDWLAHATAPFERRASPDASLLSGAGSTATSSGPERVLRIVADHPLGCVAAATSLTTALATLRDDEEPPAWAQAESLIALCEVAFEIVMLLVKWRREDIVVARTSASAALASAPDSGGDGGGRNEELDVTKSVVCCIVSRHVLPQTALLQRHLLALPPDVGGVAELPIRLADLIATLQEAMWCTDGPRQATAAGDISGYSAIHAKESSNITLALSGKLLEAMRRQAELVRWASMALTLDGGAELTRTIVVANYFLFCTLALAKAREEAFAVEAAAVSSATANAVALLQPLLRAAAIRRQCGAYHHRRQWMQHHGSSAAALLQRISEGVRRLQRCGRAMAIRIAEFAAYREMRRAAECSDLARLCQPAGWGFFAREQLYMQWCATRVQRAGRGHAARHELFVLRAATKLASSLRGLHVRCCVLYPQYHWWLWDLRARDVQIFTRAFDVRRALGALRVLRARESRAAMLLCRVGRGSTSRRLLRGALVRITSTFCGFRARLLLSFLYQAELQREARRQFEKLLAGDGWTAYQALLQQNSELNDEIEQLNYVLDRELASQKFAFLSGGASQALAVMQAQRAEERAAHSPVPPSERSPDHSHDGHHTPRNGALRRSGGGAPSGALSLSRAVAGRAVSRFHRSDLFLGSPLAAPAHRATSHTAQADDDNPLNESSPAEQQQQQQQQQQQHCSPSRRVLFPSPGETPQQRRGGADASSAARGQPPPRTSLADHLQGGDADDDGDQVSFTRSASTVALNSVLHQRGARRSLMGGRLRTIRVGGKVAVMVVAPRKGSGGEANDTEQAGEATTPPPEARSTMQRKETQQRRRRSGATAIRSSSRRAPTAVRADATTSSMKHAGGTASSVVLPCDGESDEEDGEEEEGEEEQQDAAPAPGIATHDQRSCPHRRQRSFSSSPLSCRALGSPKFTITEDDASIRHGQLSLGEQIDDLEQHNVQLRERNVQVLVRAKYALFDAQRAAEVHELLMQQEEELAELRAANAELEREHDRQVAVLDTLATQQSTDSHLRAAHTLEMRRLEMRIKDAGVAAHDMQKLLAVAEQKLVKLERKIATEIEHDLEGCDVPDNLKERIRLCNRALTKLKFIVSLAEREAQAAKYLEECRALLQHKPRTGQGDQAKVGCRVTRSRSVSPRATGVMASSPSQPLWMSTGRLDRRRRGANAAAVSSRSSPHPPTGAANSTS